jgi:DNA polymerase-3 subunit delta'
MIYPWQTGMWKSVQQALQGDHLPHALLFTGEDGCGNAEFLHMLAQSLLCLTPDSVGMPCGQCRSCQVFGAQAHPDFIAVTLQEERQAILIEQIRELNYFLGLSRSYSPRRVVTIAPAERMNMNAANSLLKSLEEPAPNTHILLLTAHPATLLPTIRSRCQAMRLPLPTPETALTWLQQHSLQHEAETLLQAARGRPLEALALDSTDTLAQRQQWLQHLSQLLQGNGNIIEISAHWEKYDKTALLDWQFECLHTIAKQQSHATAALPVVLQIMRSHIQGKVLWEMQAGLLELKKLVTHPLNPRLFVESMLMLWQARY